VHLTDAQVAQLRSTVDLDALGDDPLQGLAYAHLRRPDLAHRVVAVGQGEDGFRSRGLDPFVSHVTTWCPPPCSLLNSFTRLNPWL
jgi:hypothetical protein